MSQEQVQSIMKRFQDPGLTQPVLVPFGSLASVVHDISARGGSAAVQGSLGQSPVELLNRMSGYPPPGPPNLVRALESPRDARS